MKTIGKELKTFLSMNNYISYLAVSFVLSLLITPFVIFFSKKFNFLGRENGGRHIHIGRIPRLGGVVIFLVFWLIVLFSNDIVLDKHLIGVLIASTFLIVIGFADDIKEVSWRWQFLGQIGAVLVIIAAGVGVPYLTNPWGGLINLNQINIPILTFGNINYNLTFPADLFTLIWIILIINIVNWLDGLDGLASGVTVIGSFALFFLSLTPVVNQPQVATLAIILVGAVAGFLIYNFYPAKIFLGTSGSMFLGLMLAVLAIISGGKIATALLILGFPILDALWVILQRWRAKVSIFHPDKRHFHHKLLEIGLSQRKIVLLIYFITAAFGVIGVVGQSKGKLVGLIVLLALMVGLVWVMTRLVEKRKFQLGGVVDKGRKE